MKKITQKKMTKKELENARKMLRKNSNEYISIETLQKRLNILEKSCNYFLKLEKNNDDLLVFSLKWINKKTKNIEKIITFFDEIDVLTYIKGLENGINPSNFKI